MKENNEKSLYNLLKENAKSDIYPFHMPGHKRNESINYIPVDVDITEIDGFDNLHHSVGVLKDAKQKAAQYYGADKTWFLVNGSTSGLLIAISAVFNNNGGTVLMARNCHKAAYNAAFLNKLNLEYVFPKNGCIKSEDVRKALTNNPKIKAVVITSPTYDGLVSDVAAIADICHGKNIPLIVDEAHGAHFVMSDIFPESAINKGADVVIHSLHKTLPSMTQTALLHLKGSLVSENKIDMYSGIYQSSSPSYVMMAGMDACIDYIKENEFSLCNSYKKMLDEFYERTKYLKHLKVYIKKDAFDEEVYDKDCSKILIFCENVKLKGDNKSCDGQWLHSELLTKYNLQMEMAAADYVIALTSVMDKKEGFVRLEAALADIDSRLENISDEKCTDDLLLKKGCFGKKNYCERTQVFFSIYEALTRASETVFFEESAGKISAEYVYLYPPGIPLIVPGEVITAEFINMVKEYQKRNYDIEGLADKSLQKIQIVVN